MALGFGTGFELAFVGGERLALAAVIAFLIAVPVVVLAVLAGAAEYVRRGVERELAAAEALDSSAEEDEEASPDGSGPEPVGESEPTGSLDRDG